MHRSKSNYNEQHGYSFDTEAKHNKYKTESKHTVQYTNNENRLKPASVGVVWEVQALETSTVSWTVVLETLHPFGAIL
jgi:hypothetical protein